MNVPDFGPLTSRLMSECSWGDDYPAQQHYADECESLLVFLSELGVLNRFSPRLCSSKQKRDEALNEIRVAYFLQSLGYPVVDWEPEDAADHRVEYTVSLGAAGTAYVEVKSPGWEAEFGKEEHSRPRLREPKYSESIDGRPARPVEVIRETLEKWRVKFSGNAPSILVISDDCFIHLAEFGWWPLQTALLRNGDGLLHEADYATIGAVCLFESVLVISRRRIEYKSICLANPSAAPKAAIPREVISRLTTEPNRSGA